MGFEWFNQIDRIVWDLEAQIESLIFQSHPDMIGMAPSAGDEVRTVLRQNASRMDPTDRTAETETISESEVSEATQSLAEAVVAHATDRTSRHVTREDIAAVIASQPYPFGRD
jgi:hypothetical protein